ncbi:MAG: hypothetical protein Q9163_001423 [Psora crenata]
MRARTLSNVLTLVTAGSIVAASPAPHKHHKHGERLKARSPGNVKTINVPGPTVVAYELNGQVVNKDDVCKGIKDGSLRWAEGTETPPECSTNQEAPAQPASTTLAPIASNAAHESTAPANSHTETQSPAKQQQAMEQSAAQVSQVSHFDITQSGTAAAAYQPSISASTSSLSDQGLDKDFPDGTVDCSTFPSDYGPIRVDWTELGGWSGIQYVTIQGNSITHIDTAVPGGDGCKPGAMCSYACPAGYQKSQWPSAQGSTGQSVGGLHCNENGKLSLTNPSLSKKLCIKGTGATTVQNKLSKNAAICRTDYPGTYTFGDLTKVFAEPLGTENEVVPLNTEPRSINVLTCPDASTYFRHDGDPTSAQYYINNQGVSVQNACIWGADGTNMGNWAPSYLGVGQDAFGKTWLAISSTAQNNPTNYKPLNFVVEIVGDTSGKCRLSKGKYCSGDNYDDCNELGCTVGPFTSCLREDAELL